MVFADNFLSNAFHDSNLIDEDSNSNNNNNASTYDKKRESLSTGSRFNAKEEEIYNQFNHNLKERQGWIEESDGDNIIRRKQRLSNRNNEKPHHHNFKSEFKYRRFQNLRWEERKMTNEFIEAIYQNYISKIRSILAMNPKIVYNHNNSGDSSLRAAAKEGNVYVMDILFHFLFDVDKELADPVTIIEDSDNSDRTALHLACQWGRDEVVNVLLDHNAFIYSRDCEGNTPLHLALRHGHIECVKNMLQYYPDPLLPNNKGKTPLDEIQCNIEANSYPNSAALSYPYLHDLITNYLETDYFIYMKEVLDFESNSQVSRLNKLPECIIDIITTFLSGASSDSTSEANVTKLKEQIKDKKKKSLGGLVGEEDEEDDKGTGVAW